MYGIPPFGYNYLSPAPPLFATPFINAGDGTENQNPYPALQFPQHNVSASNPYTSFNFEAVIDHAAPYFYYRNSSSLHRKLWRFPFSGRSRRRGY